MKITALKARQIYDSRGRATIEVDLYGEGLARWARASVPSGASKGRNEAVELRDEDGSMSSALKLLNGEIKDSLVGRDFASFAELDRFLIELDGTENKKRLGANSILAVSMAGSKAFAMKKGVPLFKSFFPDAPQYPLPIPLLNLINGGAHANNGLAIQEFMIVPVNFQSFADSIWAASKVFHSLKNLLNKNNLYTGVGDEGGFAPNINSEFVALDMLISAIEQAGFKPGEDIFIALDVAASEFYKNNHYHINNAQYTSSQMIDFIKGIIKNYPIYSVEDPLAEDDRKAWQKLTADLGGEVQIIGDDIFVTNIKYLQKAIDDKIANSVLIKPNQIGTVFETIQTINLANQFDYSTIMSHRSGETEDVAIAHLAVGLGTSQIKAGSLCRSERTAKYNELIRIEEILGDKGYFVGAK